MNPKDPFTTYVTPHFQLGELALWQEQRRFQHAWQMDVAKELCCFLEVVREHFKARPVIITSGYRPPAINAAVGGASGSEHLFDQPEKGAVDVQVERVPILDVETFISARWPYSVGLGARSRGMVHVGIRPGRPRVRWNY